MLRARPKHKTRFERFIVLEECDPVEAGKRYAEVMAKKNRRKQIQLEQPNSPKQQYPLGLPISHTFPTEGSDDYTRVGG